MFSGKIFNQHNSKLSVLSSYFPNVPVVGLTATATLVTQKDICWTLGLIDPVIISVNPDQPNMYLKSHGSNNMEDEQYHPVGASPVAKN